MSSRWQNVAIESRARRSPFVLVCDHASRDLPARYGTLGLDARALESHIAWDPGALDLSRALAKRLDAALVASTVSRLVVDCNRALDAPNLFWTLSENTLVPGNHELSDEERAERIDTVHAPFHGAVDELLRERGDRETILVAMHSFTPVYRGIARPWVLGIIAGQDERFARALHDALAPTGETVGWNEPYSAADGVTYTLERHGAPRDLPRVMVELRNDAVAEPAMVERWADHLAAALRSARTALLPTEGTPR